MKQMNEKIGNRDSFLPPSSWPCDVSNIFILNAQPLSFLQLRFSLFVLVLLTCISFWSLHYPEIMLSTGHAVKYVDAKLSDCFPCFVMLMYGTPSREICAGALFFSTLPTLAFGSVWPFSLCRYSWLTLVSHLSI